MLSYNQQQGFTLIEVMTSFSILLIISTVVYLGFIQGTKYYAQGNRKASVIQSGRGALELMSRSLTEAKSISVAGSNTVTFVQYDYDSNNDGSDDTIRYYLESISGRNRLRKDVNSAFQRYLTDADENVASLTFEYFSTNPSLDTNADGLANSTEIDAGGNGNGSLDGVELIKIGYIKINLELAKTQGSNTSSISLATSAYLRNLR